MFKDKRNNNNNATTNKKKAHLITYFLCEFIFCNYSKEKLTNISIVYQINSSE